MQRFKSIFKRKERNQNTTVSHYLTFGNRLALVEYNDPEKAFEGYIKNIVVYKCISLISDQVGRLKWKLDVVNGDGDVVKTLSNHPVLDLLNKPYVLMNGSTFNRTIAAQKLVYGNYYIEKIYENRTGLYQHSIPINLYPLRPDKVSVTPGKNHIPTEYRYSDEHAMSITFNVTDLGYSNIIHGMDYNPQSEFHGLSPLVPAGYSIDLHNEIGRSNIGFMQNGMQPSGILTIPADVDYDPDKMEVLINQIKEKHSGVENKNTPLVLNNGMTWQQVSVTSKDSMMDEFKKSAAQEIGLAFNVPMDLLNIEPSKFDNLHIAYEQLYMDAVIPTGNHLADELNGGLIPLYKDSRKLKLRADFSHTKVMRDAAIRVMEKINPITLISNNEKRKMVDLEPMEGEDNLSKVETVTPEMSETIAEEMNSGATYQEAKALARIINAR